MDELAVRLDRDMKMPLFEQLYLYLKMNIIDGTFKRDEKLPSKRRLADNLQCSLNTVQGAYSQLAAEGYIVARAKSGYYVAALDGVLTMERSVPDQRGGNGPIKKYKYDFSHQGVDPACFPFTTWRKLAKEVINEYDGDLLKTGDPKGYPALRASIARYLHHSRGVTCRPEQVIISSGTEFLLQLLIQLFDAGSVYAIENPGYDKLNMIYKSNRVGYRAIALDDSGMRPDMLADSGATVACITPSHQFPTGRIMPVGRRIQLLNWACDAPDRYIIEDDYDSEFRYSGKPIPSLQSLDGQGKVIYIGAFSKSLSPALRISYMVLPEVLLQDYNERLSFYICPVPTIEQKTLQRFMDEGHFERHLNRTRNIYRQKREAVVSAIRELLPEAEIQGASAGLHLTLRVKNGMSGTALVQKAGEQQVRVYSLARYYSDLSTGDDGDVLLLGFATLDMTEIYDAVALLKKAWNA